MKTVVMCLLASFSVFRLSAHYDYGIVRTNGMVTTCTYSGYDFEERYILEIIGELADILSREMCNETHLYLDYIHQYTSDDFNPFYRVGYGDFVSFEEEQRVETKGLILRIFASTLDVETVLKLIEYAFSNEKSIKANVKPVVDSLWQYGVYKMSAIEDGVVKKVLDKKTSRRIEKLMTKRIYRPKKYEGTEISYYYQNGKYHIIKFDPWGNETLLDVFDSIYHICADSQGVLVFDKRDSFTYISHNGGVEKYGKHSFDASGCYAPYSTYGFGWGLVLIYSPVIGGYTLEERRVLESGGEDGLELIGFRTMSFPYKIMFYSPGFDDFVEEGTNIIFDTLLRKANGDIRILRKR